MFGAIKGYFFGGSSTQNTSNSLKENKPLKSDVSNSNLDSNKNTEKKRTIIKGDKDKFDFSCEYDEDEPKISSSTSENSSSNENENKTKNKINNDIELNSIQNMDNINYWRMAHCIYVKNSLININTMDYVPFYKLKKKNEGIFSYIGFGSESFDEVKYLVGFDEHFIYMINLSKEENKDDNDAMKTIGNHYDITKISNIEIIEDPNSKNKILITILFVLDNDVDNFCSKIKKFYFEKKNASKFLKILKAYLNNYKVKISYNDKVFGNIKFNEIEEIKREKIIETKEINIEDKKDADEKEEKKVNNENIDNDNNKEDKKEKNEEKRNLDKDENKENDEEKKEKEDKNNEEEIFTSENVEEQKVEKENNNLIDI